LVISAFPRPAAIRLMVHSPIGIDVGGVAVQVTALTKAMVAAKRFFIEQGWRQ